MEADISDAITRFEKEYMGKGPLETKTHILEDMIIIRLRGILTKAEIKLLKTDRKFKVRDLIKQFRNELLENGRVILETIIKTITKRKVRTLHSDISTVNDEKIIIFILERPIDIG